MKSMKDTNFAVQLPLCGKDIQDLRNLILEFLKKKVQDDVIENYVPLNKGDIEKHTPVSLGILIGSTVKIGDPSSDDFSKVLDLIKEYDGTGTMNNTPEVNVAAIFFPI